MSHNQRGIGLFMVAGSVLAVVIGLAVWNTSTSQRTVTAGYTQETEAAAGGSVATASSPQRTQRQTQTQTQTQPRPKTQPATTKSNPTSKRRRTADAGYDPSVPAGGSAAEPVVQAAPAQGRYRVEDDPLAPPYAVTSQAPTAAPTTHYRRTNARPVEQSGDSGQESAPATQTSQTVASSTQESPQTSQPSRTEAPTTAPTTATETPDVPVTETSEVTRKPGDEGASSSAAPTAAVETSSAATSDERADAESDADEENLGGLLPG